MKGALQHGNGQSLNLAEHLRRQFAYDAWANREVLAAMRKNGGENARSLQLVVAHFGRGAVWLERLMGRASECRESGPRRISRSVRLKSRISSSACGLHYLVSLTRPFVETISYKNSKGEPWTSTIVDVLTHVVMHSAYHRGQIASHMRENGQTPAYTDFIHGVRQGSGEVGPSAGWCINRCASGRRSALCRGSTKDVISQP